MFIEEYYQASPELLLAEMIRLELLTDQHLKPYTKTNVTTESVSVKEEESKKSKPEKEKKKKKEKSKKKKG